MAAEMAPRTPCAGQPCLASPLTRKLSQVISLSAAEAAVLRDPQSTTRFVARNRAIIAEGGKYGGLLVLME